MEATDKIEIRKDAKLIGDIRTARIIIEDGAYFKGSIDIVKPEPAKGAPKAQPAAAAPRACRAASGGGQRSGEQALSGESNCHAGAAEEYFSRISRRRTGGRPAFALRRRSSCRRTLAADTRETVLSTRTSRGLEEFFTQIRDTSGLTILDLGGATQKNVSFITDLGHRLYSEDFLRILNETFGVDDTVDQSNPGRIEYFLKQTLDYPEGHFDGVLMWDVLEYLNPVLLNAVVERLHKIVRPKAYMLAFFQADDKLDAAPVYTFRIEQVNSLEVLQQGLRRPGAVVQQSQPGKAVRTV